MSTAQGRRPAHLIAAVITFLVPFVIVAEMVSRLFLVNFLQSEVNAGKSIESFEAGASRDDVLFLGNSYSFYGIDPDRVRLRNGLISHNFSFAGEGVGDTYYKLAYYLRRQRLRKLKLVVINVDNYNFFGPAAPLNTAYPYGRFYDIPDIYRTVPAFAKPALLSKLSLYRVSRQAKTLIGNRLFVSPVLERIQPSGYSRRDYGMSAASLSAETAAYLDLERVKVFAINPALFGYYKKLVSEFRKRNIAVIFIIVPTPAMFLPKAAQAGLLAENPADKRDFLEEKTAAGISRLFPGIPVYNYQKDSTGFSIDMFSDRGHLNYKGAGVFSEKLAADVNSYLDSTGRAKLN